MLLPTWLMLMACGDEQGPHRPHEPPVSPAPVSDTDLDPVDDTDTDPPPEPVGFVQGPAFAQNANWHTPMVQVLTAATDVPCRLDVTLVSDVQQVELSFDAFASDHDLDILGLYADSTFDAVVTATTEDGLIFTSDPLVVVTPPLPEGFPPFEVLVSDPARMEPGVTLFHSRMANPAYSYVIGVDGFGEVVWFFQDDPTIYQELHRLPNGRLVATHDIAAMDHPGHHIFEFDVRGRPHGRWTPADVADHLPDAIPVAVPTIHHDAQEGPDGRRLLLTVEHREVDGYPTSETNPDAPTETATVAADVVVEMARDGTVLDRWPIADYLDPRRIGYDSVKSTFWSNFFGPGTRDWAHTNAVFYDDAHDALVVSSNYQDAIFRIDRSTRTLSWILAPPANWRPAWRPYLLEPVGDDFHWSYHQHAPMLTPQGTLLLFDNGNHRASAYEPRLPDAQNRSRVVEYAIDPVAMTVTQLWQYGAGSDRMFSKALGDADWMPTTGNVLVVFGAITEGNTPYSTRIVEVTHTDPPDAVFDLVQGGHHTMYRAERVSSLYPD